ncbi:MAG: PilW family protein [Gammaproteobacteria bacterium]|nr:PilW family protein [Gammaproteobacteria bacterium]
MLSKQKGLTLTELMVAIAIGLVVSAAVAGLFLQNKANSEQNQEISYLQDNGRYALKILADDLKMANFWGGYQSGNRSSISIDSAGIPNIDAVLKLASNCGATAGAGDWDYDLTNFLEYTTSASAKDSFNCIEYDSTAIDSDTEVLLVKRTVGQPLAAASALTIGAPYLRTNRSVATIHKATVSTGDPVSDYFDWKYQSRIYFIEGATLKRWSLRENEADPTTDPVYVKEELAAGIENFHIVYGIDNSTPWTDGVADFYTSAPTADELKQAINATIYVLVRGSKPVTGYKNDKTYQLGDNKIAAANDGYYRRVYSTTVLMKNSQSMLK